MHHAQALQGSFIVDHIRRVGRSLLPFRWINVTLLEGGAVRLTIEFPSEGAVLEALTEIGALREMAREDLRHEREQVAESQS